jgi:hypothetical protein
MLVDQQEELDSLRREITVLKDIIALKDEIIKLQNEINLTKVYPNTFIPPYQVYNEPYGEPYKINLTDIVWSNSSSSDSS